jgi:hypothetical protein
MAVASCASWAVRAADRLCSRAMQRLAVIALVLFACDNKKAPTPTTGSASGSAPVAIVDAPAAVPDAAVAAGSGSGSGSGSAAAGSGSGSGSEAFDFDKLEHDEKVTFMKTKVLPEMKRAFQSFDKRDFARFTCKTCHGKDPQKTKYKMPNPELPKLDFAALKAGKQEPKTAEFMAKVVTPQMAKMLGKPEHSEANPDGFGCLACHEQKK